MANNYTYGQIINAPTTAADPSKQVNVQVYEGDRVVGYVQMSYADAQQITNRADRTLNPSQVNEFKLQNGDAFKQQDYENVPVQGSGLEPLPKTSVQPSEKTINQPQTEAPTNLNISSGIGVGAGNSSQIPVTQNQTPEITFGKPEYSQEKHSWVSPVLKDGKPTGEVYEGGGLADAQKLQGESVQDVYHERFADEDTGLSAGDFLYGTKDAQDYLAKQNVKNWKETNKAWEEENQRQIEAYAEQGGDFSKPGAPLFWDKEKNDWSRPPTDDEKAFLLWHGQISQQMETPSTSGSVNGSGIGVGAGNSSQIPVTQNQTPEITFGKPEYSQEKHSWVSPILKDGKPTGEVYEGGGLADAQKLQGESVQDVYHERFADEDTGLSAGDFLYGTKDAQDYLAKQQAEQARLAENTANAQRIAEEANRQEWISDGQGNYVSTGTNGDEPAPSQSPTVNDQPKNNFDSYDEKHDISAGDILYNTQKGQDFVAQQQAAALASQPLQAQYDDYGNFAGFNRPPTDAEQWYMDSVAANERAAAEAAWYAGVQRAEAEAAAAVYYDSSQRVEDVTSAAEAGQYLSAQDESLLAAQQGWLM